MKLKNTIYMLASLACALLLCGCAGENEARAGDGKIADEVISTTTQAAATSSTSSESDVSTTMPEQGTSSTVPDVRVEVYHFHGNAQCESCIKVGAYAENTVNRHYISERASGKISFAHVNYDLPENKELAKKYGVTGSSLWIGTYANGVFHKEENIKVWYRIDDEDAYISYLKGVLDKRLAGDLT